jgi:hypothetical protein
MDSLCLALEASQSLPRALAALHADHRQLLHPCLCRASLANAPAGRPRNLLQRCQARLATRALAGELASIELALDCSGGDPRRLAPALRWLASRWRLASGVAP